MCLSVITRYSAVNVDGATVSRRGAPAAPQLFAYISYRWHGEAVVARAEVQAPVVMPFAGQLVNLEGRCIMCARFARNERAARSLVSGGQSWSAVAWN